MYRSDLLCRVCLELASKEHGRDCSYLRGANYISKLSITMKSGSFVVDNDNDEIGVDNDEIGVT